LHKSQSWAIFKARKKKEDYLTAREKQKRKFEDAGKSAMIMERPDISTIRCLKFSVVILVLL